MKLDYMNIVRGYGNRTVAKRIGIASYFGRRATQQSNPNPVEGPGMADKCQYYRADNQLYHEYMMIVNKMLNHLSNIAWKIRMRMDPFMSRLLNTNDKIESFNRLKTITFGKYKNTKSFACEIHTDTTDLLSKRSINQIKDKLEKANSESQFEKGFQQKERYSYGNSFIKKFSLGQSTVLMYQLIKTKMHSESSIFQQFFILETLKFAFQIFHGSSALLYPFAFPHGTTLALEVFPDGTVSAKNDDDNHMTAISFTS